MGTMEKGLKIRDLTHPKKQGPASICLCLSLVLWLQSWKGLLSRKMEGGKKDQSRKCKHQKRLTLLNIIQVISQFKLTMKWQASFYEFFFDGTHQIFTYNLQTEYTILQNLAKLDRILYITEFCVIFKTIRGFVSLQGFLIFRSQPIKQPYRTMMLFGKCSFGAL